jgi:hypothetical protein
MFLTVALAVVASCAPWSPLVNTIYYEYQLHAAAAAGALHGTDITATYGPLGFVGLPVYHPATWTWMLVLQALLLVMFVARLWLFVEAVWPAALPAFPVIALAVIGPCAAIPQPEWSPLLFLAVIHAVLQAVEWHVRGLQRPGWAEVLSAVLLGLSALVKVNLFPVAVLTMIAATLLAPARSRWALPALFLGTLVVGGALTGHSPLQLARFIRAALDTASGYTHGMALWSAGDARFAWLFVAVAIALTLAAAVAGLLRGGPRTLAATAVLAMAFFQLFANGFVRSDGPHTTANALALISCVPVVALALPRRFAALLGAGLAMWAVWSELKNPQLPEPRPERATESARAMLSLPTVAQSLREGRAQLMAQLAAIYPLRGLGEGGMVLDGNPAALEANGMPWRVAPTLNAYGAYTEGLARHNAEVLEAQRWVLSCTPLPLEERVPTLHDHQVPLTLLKSFQLQGGLGPCALFTRLDTPRQVRLEPQGTAEARLGEPIAVPDAGGRPIWVALEVPERPLGRLVHTLKLTPIWFDDDRGRRMQLDTRMSGSGFLLSPRIGFGRGVELGTFARPELPRVVRFTVSAGPSPAPFGIEPWVGTVRATFWAVVVE